VVLIDFGSARQYVEGMTMSQTTILTPGYAPPEQYNEKNKRGSFTDIYALGATLYFLLTKNLLLVFPFYKNTNCILKLNMFHTNKCIFQKQGILCQ
jgi:serine/threonine protein kinase